MGGGESASSRIMSASDSSATGLICNKVRGWCSPFCFINLHVNSSSAPSSPISFSLTSHSCLCRSLWFAHFASPLPSSHFSRLSSLLSLAPVNMLNWTHAVCLSRHSLGCFAGALLAGPSVECHRFQHCFFGVFLCFWTFKYFGWPYTCSFLCLIGFGSFLALLVLNVHFSAALNFQKNSEFAWFFL